MSSQLTFSGHPYPGILDPPEARGKFFRKQLVFLFATLLLKNFSQQQQSQTNGLLTLVGALRPVFLGALEPLPAGSGPVLAGLSQPFPTSLLGTFQPNNRSHFAARSLLHFYPFFLFFLPLAIFHFAAYLLKKKKFEQKSRKHKKWQEILLY